MRLSLLALLLFAAIASFAGGPLVIGGPADVPGAAFKWDATVPISYWTDLGNLGTLNKAAADQFTAQMFAVWTSTPGVQLTTVQAGSLSVDVTGANILALANDPASEFNTKSAIVYDADGSATDALLGAGASNHILGFAGPNLIRSNGASNIIASGNAVLNGKFIDGISSATNPEVAQEKFKEAFIHEFGHLLGLHHSQINVEVLDNIGARTPDILAGLPIMFPFLLNTAARPSLATDDVAQIRELYPGPIPSATGKITGHIFFSDGVVPAQGYNVVARQVDNPATPQDESRIVAVSSVSGFRFTEDAGNTALGRSGSSFGSRDPALIGEYEIVGLPPGNYTVQVEAVNPRFLHGSGVGPMTLFQFQMVGFCTIEFFNTAESNQDNCFDSSQVFVGLGAVISGVDIILNGTAPGTDAWEGSDLRLDRAPLADLDRAGGVA